MKKKGKGTMVVTLEVKVRWDDEEAKAKVMKALATTFNGNNNKMECISSAGYSWDLSNKNAQVAEKCPMSKHIKF